MDPIDPARLSRPAGARIAPLFGADERPLAASTPRLPPLAPPIVRGSMAPRPWLGFSAGLRAALLGRGEAPVSAHPPADWERAARRRRRGLTAATLACGIGAAALLAQARPASDAPMAEALMIGLFALLFAWVSAGFLTALIGFVVQLRGDRHSLSARSVANRPLHASARTAIVMPICNEHVPTVFAGLRATCESLAATGVASLFEVFVLSDTSDPAVRAAEVAAWAELRAALGDGARVHYRWRQRRTKRKAGNVADFCRRWGRRFRYMVVLDADSVMSGDALVTLVKLMEANPRAGIVQTAPATCGHDTLHARAQQFAGRVAGRLFTLGMQFWQLGESHYWGHNAIIRVEPFMQHCALAPIAGRGGLAGEILSHDFVEAALMRRAGYHVWLVHDLEGSYEQQPPNLLEELKRDRRWCQGNLQNVRLIAEPGLHPVHRVMLATGAMSYASAPLWFAFIVLAALLGGGVPASLAHDAPLPGAMLALWGCTVAMLALPRLLGLAALVMRGEAKRHGGLVALVAGSALEAALSLLQAPVRMAAHSLFVIVALTGLKLDWKSPPREASAVSWSQASSQIGLLALGALAPLAAVALVAPAAAIALLPVAGPLLLALPLAVATGDEALGRRLRARGLLVVPEESAAPRVLRVAEMHARRAAALRNAATEGADDSALFELWRAAMAQRAANLSS